MADGDRLDPGIHEHGSHLLFDEHGLSPMFAVAKQFDIALDNRDTFQAAGDTWRLNHEESNVSKWTGKLAGRDSDTFDAWNEYNIGVVSADDDVARKTVNFQFRPAFPDPHHVDSGEPIQVLPEDLPEGIRVQIDSANVEPSETTDVLQGLAEFLGIRPTYFDSSNIHEWSRTYNLAVYVRLDRDLNEDHIVCRQGLLDQLAQLASTEQGQGEYRWDNEEIQGHRNAIALNETSLSKLYESHNVGKLLKSYHMANPQEDPDEDDPTTYPKIEVQYSTDYSEHRSVPWFRFDADDDRPIREDIRHELETYLLNALSWADIPTHPDEDVYVEDEYWSVEARPEDAPAIDLHPDPIEGIVEQERDVATAALVDTDYTDREESVLRTLADGGAQHYERLADQAGTSTSTVYRAAKKFDQIVERASGHLELADDVVRTRLNELFESVDRALDWAQQNVSELAHDGVDVAKDSALGKWIRRYGAVMNDSREGIEIVLENGKLSRDELRRILRAGYDAAHQTMGVDYYRFANAIVFYYDREMGQMRRYGRVAVTQGGRLKIGGYVVD